MFLVFFNDALRFAALELAYQRLFLTLRMLLFVRAHHTCILRKIQFLGNEAGVACTTEHCPAARALLNVRDLLTKPKIDINNQELMAKPGIDIKTRN